MCGDNTRNLTWAAEIGEQEGPWPPLNLRPLHRIVIFAIENHFSLKVICNENFTCVFYCINMFVLLCNAQKNF